MSVIAKMFSPMQSSKSAEQKPKLTQRLTAIFGRAVELEQLEAESKISTYGVLVERLAESELDATKKTPTPDAVREICLSAGKTVDDLQAAVAIAVEVKQLHEGLVGESSVVESLADVVLRIDAHRVEFERMVATMQAKGDQLQAERQELETSVREFAAMRTRLISLVGVESQREVELKEQLIQLIKDEADLRRQSGLASLPEKYITCTLDASDEGKRLKEVELLIAEMTEAGETGQRVFGRLQVEQAKLADWIQAHRRLHELGARVAKLRLQIQSMSNEKEKLAAERIAAIGRA